ncbi:MAG: CDP-glycerol glycerophosphotransferase family protein [Spirochaetaceae bacterium]|jgi:hypothetical protein|nr:CDP-glycerol glycerophosphotransferase family protein [Spirochaetaceae bacterium]
MYFNPLYIDPGTGSILFSILIGAAATLYFLARALLIKAKTLFSGVGKAAPDAAIRPVVLYSEGIQYWNVFKPVLDAFERRKQRVTYLTSARDDPVFASLYEYVAAEYIGEGNAAFTRLNFLSAQVVLMTTPALNVYQLKRSKTVRHYAHILHSPGDATLYRLFGLDYFDSVLLTGEYQGEDIRALERQRNLPAKTLVTVGCTYLDQYAEKLASLPVEDPHPFTALVSPSWGASGLLSRYGEKLLDPLVTTGWRIIVRPHPQSKRSESALLERLTARYRESPNVQWDYERDNIGSLAKADVMISDFSGIIFDYAFLRDKPVLYVSAGMDLRPYDADDIDREPRQFGIAREIGAELREADFARIGEVAARLSDNAEYRAARVRAKEAAWGHRGEAGERTAAFIISTLGAEPPETPEESALRGC